jgi:aryl-alcohol dehydrogenase-like predicted oxidoreductase
MDATLATEQLTIGKSDITVAPLGVGAWSWGERRFWGYGGEFGRDDVAGAFKASIEAGTTLFDTAELYGKGESERLLGEFAREAGRPIVIATKFAPYPWRVSARSLRPALMASLQRLGVARVDLYQIHFPYTILSINALMDALADVVADGLVRAVGVSNYSAAQTRRAHEALTRRVVPLASNQVQYNLFSRRPEVNGVAAACRELGVTLIAYSPLAQGLLTGKYGPGARPADARHVRAAFRERNLRHIAGVLDLLRGIGVDHGGKTPAQVALNWLIQQGNVLPIPGAKTAAQAASNAGALGWALRDTEVAALSEATRRWQR